MRRGFTMWENKKRLSVIKFLEFMEELEETERVRMCLIALNEILEDSQKGLTEGAGWRSPSSGLSRPGRVCTSEEAG